MIVSGLNHTLHDAFGGDPKPKKIVKRIVYKRLFETENSTIGKYYVEGTDIEGYFIEPSGPSTTESNTDRRIPAGEYFLTKNPIARNCIPCL